MTFFLSSHWRLCLLGVAIGGASVALIVVTPPGSTLRTDLAGTGQCAVEGALCRTDADCGSCGATCRDLGTQNSSAMVRACSHLPPRNPDCAGSNADGPECQCRPPQRWNARTQACGFVCDYSLPPAGCRYEGGGTDPFVCDARLVCDTEVSATPFPYIPGGQVTCSSCLAQGKTYACYDIHDPDALYERGFCSDHRISRSPADVLHRPDCTYCQAAPGVGWCPEDMLECPGGFKVGRIGPDCRFPACPAQRSFVLSFGQEPLRVGQKTGIAVCAVDEQGRIDSGYRGFVTIEYEAGGPLGDQPLYQFSSLLIFDQGCHAFPQDLHFIRPGVLRMTVTSKSIRDAYGETEGTAPVVVSKTVLAAEATPTPRPGCLPGQVFCNGQCFPGNCCSNADCRPGQSCANLDGQGSFCRGETASPTPTACPTLPAGCSTVVVGANGCPTCAPSSSPVPRRETCASCLAQGKPVLCRGGFYIGEEPTSCETTLPSNDPLIADAPTCVVCPVPSPVPTSSPVGLKGDLNGDGRVDVADLAKLADYLLGRIRSL